MDGFELLLQGKLIDAILYPFISLIGAPLFYAILFAGAIGLIYIKTKDVGLIGLASILISGAGFKYLPPTLHKYLVLLLAGSIGLVIYKVLKG